MFVGFSWATSVGLLALFDGGQRASVYTAGAMEPRSKRPSRSERLTIKMKPENLRIAFLLGLLAIVQAESPRALVGIVWRVAVLSWDNPATQVAQDIATASVPRTDCSRDVYERARYSARSLGRAPLPELNHASEGPTLSRRVTRAPPAA